MAKEIKEKNIVVVGGGAAGMMAALSASSSRKTVILLERNREVGRKLYITGKGRCNITTGLSIEEIIANIPGNGPFLYSSLSQFHNKDLCDFFESSGLKLKEERGSRIFPQSDRAGDVVSVFKKKLKKGKVKILSEQRVKELAIEAGNLMGVISFSGTFYPASSVVIATGGITYPATGSTGDGYILAKQAGHTIVTPRPSLTGLKCRENWIKDLEGLTLKNVRVTLKYRKSHIDSIAGEMLFTDTGLSGPVILTLSRKAGEILEKNPSEHPVLSLDLKPALDFEKLDLRIKRDFSENLNRYFKNSLDRLFPKSLVPVMVRLSGISPLKKVNQITHKERMDFVRLIKDLSFEVEDLEGPERAVITAGGVNVKEINPKTMESRLLKGLFFAGEVMDVDGFTGGFNLQIAFSTGRAAGLWAANSC